ncbi:hypothetical protein Hanom_Chr11g01047251 [Helianthus anomalus]
MRFNTPVLFVIYLRRCLDVLFETYYHITSSFNFEETHLSIVYGWSLWLTKHLDLVPNFLEVHGWSLWFALCNAFSPQLLPKVHGWSLSSALCKTVTHLVTKRWVLSALQSANHKDHPCTFGKSWGLNTLQSANNRNQPFTFEKLGTKSKILVNHRDYPCTLEVM